MNELKIFEHPDFGKIRTVTIDDEPYLVGRDVAEVLGYSNPSKAVIAHVDDEDKRFEMLPIADSQNGNLIKTAIINESGLYAKTGQLEPTLNNAILYLRNHPDFKGKFGYNPMSDDITVSGEMPWQKKRTVGKKNSLDSVIEDEKKGGRKDGIWYIDTEGPDFLAYFEKLGYQSRGAMNGLLENALKIVALENSYHPIKSYLDELVWDGKPRMETTFIRWLGAEDNELNREITKLWFIAAVDRIVRPGHQFDQILITTGKQGIGKSKLLRLLAKGHFTNSLTGTNMDKKTAELLQDVWIVELGELDSIKKGEQTAVKNFITSTTDRYRAAYAHAAKT